MTVGPQRPLNSEDRYWARRSLVLGETSLRDVRASAEKWRSGLTSLTGVLTAALAVAAPFVGGSLQDGAARLVILAAMVLAVIALGIGTWKAMSAAFGIPTKINRDGESLRVWSENAAETAVDQLSCARLMTVIGFGFLLIAAGVGLLCSSPDPKVNRVALKDGSEYCGSLTFRDDGATVVVTGGDGTTHSAPVMSIASINTAESCD